MRGVLTQREQIRCK